MLRPVSPKSAFGNQDLKLIIQKESNSRLRAQDSKLTWLRSNRLRAPPPAVAPACMAVVAVEVFVAVGLQPSLNSWKTPPAW